MTEKCLQQLPTFTHKLLLLQRAELFSRKVRQAQRWSAVNLWVQIRRWILVRRVLSGLWNYLPFPALHTEPEHFLQFAFFFMDIQSAFKQIFTLFQRNHRTLKFSLWVHELFKFFPLLTFLTLKFAPFPPHCISLDACSFPSCSHRELFLKQVQSNCTLAFLRSFIFPMTLSSRSQANAYKCPFVQWHWPFVQWRFCSRPEHFCIGCLIWGIRTWSSRVIWWLYRVAGWWRCWWICLTHFFSAGGTVLSVQKSLFCMSLWIVTRVWGLIARRCHSWPEWFMRSFA